MKTYKYVKAVNDNNENIYLVAEVEGGRRPGASTICTAPSEEAAQKIVNALNATVGGKMAVVAKGYQFYLTKRMHDVYGKRVADPSGVIRVNGLAKWKDPDGGRVIPVVVDEIVSPEMVVCHYADGRGEVEAPFHELTAAR